MKSRSEAAKQSSTSPSSSASTGEPFDDQGELEPGDELSLTLGPVTFFPVRFNGFSVGPVMVKTTVRTGETGVAAFVRVRGFLEKVMRYEFEVERKSFNERRQALRGMV